MSNLTIPVWNTKIPDNTMNYIERAFNDRSISTGKYTKQFEDELSKLHNSNEVVCVNSGTSALKSIAIGLGLKPGDEIIIPRRSWIATVNSFFELGLKIRFADIESDRPLLSVKSLEKIISDKTKAVVTVHLNGRNSINHDLLKIIKNYSIPLIQDSAQSFLCSVPNKLDQIPTYQAYSFSLAKLLTTGQGGCIITSDKSFADKIRKIRTQGLGNISRPSSWSIGSNYRISDLLTSIGLSQLEIISQKKEKLIEIYKLYKVYFRGQNFLKDIPVNIENNEIPLYSEFLFEDRDSLVNYLDSKGIETRPFYKDLDTAHYAQNNLNISFNESIFSKKGLTLPGGDGLDIIQQKEVIDEIFTFYKNH